MDFSTKSNCGTTLNDQRCLLSTERIGRAAPKHVCSGSTLAILSHPSVHPKLHGHGMGSGFEADISHSSDISDFW